MPDTIPQPQPRPRREAWAWIPGHKGRYQVSSLGRVRSCIRPEPVILRAWVLNRHGTYRVLQVHLMRRDGSRQAATVHTLVAAAFLGPRPEGMEVCHNNGDALDNRSKNLRYDTRAANNADRLIHGTIPRGEAHGNAKLNREQVEVIRAWRGRARDLASAFGVTATTINRIRAGRGWKHIPTPPAPNREANRAARLATQETAHVR